MPNLTPSELREVLDLATTDIKVNRIAWGKRTTIHDAAAIIKICINVIKRAAS